MRGKIIVFLFLCIILTFSVSAQTSQSYPLLGANIKAENQRAMSSEAVTSGYTTLSGSTGDLGGFIDNTIGAVIGNVDDDPAVEIVIAGENGIIIQEWNETLSQPVTEYTLATYKVKSPVTLYDHDDDGTSELYFCGLNAANNPFFFKFNTTGGTLNEVWTNPMANGVTSPSTGKVSACYAGAAAGDNNRIGYVPVCTEVSGVDYCYYVGGSDNIAHTGRNNEYVTLYRMTTATGSETKNDLSATIVEGACTGDVFGAGAVSFLFNTRPNLNYKFWNLALGDVDEDGIPEIFIPLDCADGVGGSIKGMALVDAGTMALETAFATNGYVTYADGEIVASSPMYVDDGIDDGVVFSYEPTPGADFEVMLMGGTGAYTSIETLAFIDYTFEGVYTSNPFRGGFTSDPNQYDVCFIADDQVESDYNFGCIEIFSGGFDTGQADTTEFADQGVDVFPWQTSDTTGPTYDLAGSALADDVGGNLGIYVGEGLDSGFDSRAAMSFPAFSGTCVPADVDTDTFTDWVCMNRTALTLYIHAKINTPVDFRAFTPEIGSDKILCKGYNQSFKVSAPTAGYIDADGDAVRLKISCDNDGFDDIFTNLTTYGASFCRAGGACTVDIAGCFYNTSGQHTALLCMDSTNNEGSYDCAQYQTTVSTITGCVIPGPSPTYVTPVVVPESGGGPAVEDGEIFVDFKDSVQKAQRTVTGAGQDNADLFYWVIILAIFVMCAVRFGPLVGVGCGMAMLVLFTVMNFVRGVYLVGILILALLLLFLWAILGLRSANG